MNVIEPSMVRSLRVTVNFPSYTNRPPLELAGIIRGVPVNKLQYVAPPPELPPGQPLTADDLNLLTAQEYDQIEYGMATPSARKGSGSF